MNSGLDSGTWGPDTPAWPERRHWTWYPRAGCPRRGPTLVCRGTFAPAGWNGKAGPWHARAISPLRAGREGVRGPNISIYIYLHLYIYIEKIYIYIYIYYIICTRKLGPPKAGYTNKQKTLVRMNVYFLKKCLCWKNECSDLHFGVLVAFRTTNYYLEYFYEVRWTFLYIWRYEKIVCWICLNILNNLELYMYICIYK